MKFASICILMISFVVLFVFSSDVQAAEEELYKVGVGDLLGITVIGHRDLSVSTPVVVDGTIAFPHLGSIYVKDKTLLGIESEITEKLAAGYVKFPVVSVSLIRSESKRIYIHGQAGSGGTMPYEKDLSVIKALSIAGGIAESGLYGKLKVRRKQKGGAGYLVVEESDLDNGNIIEKNVEDLLLQPEDILMVERSNTFFMRGEIAKGGRYILERGMTIARALALSEGITENGLHGKVKLMRIREGGSGYVEIKEANLDDGILTSKEMEDMLLETDDIVKVERSESIFIEGEVSASGRFILEYGMTVGRAITIAGGITEGGAYGKVKVRRKRSVEAGFEDIEIDIKGIMEGSKNEDMLLHPDDILIIERSKTYIVYGEVNRIGEFPLADDTTVFKAILAAGGFNKWGSESKVKILRPLHETEGFDIIKVDIGDILEGDVTADIKLEPKDIVVVSSGLF